MTAAESIRLHRQLETFAQTYGDGPIFVLRAPARINLLGEHVDYADYLPTSSLAFGSHEHEMTMLYRPSEHSVVRGSSTLPGCGGFAFDLAEAPAPASLDEDGGAWTHYLYTRTAPAPNWDNYVRGAVFYARMKFGERIRRGLQFLVDSTIPSAGGASSSSALTVLAGAAIRCTNEIPFDALDLARDSARAEWFVGTRGGSMDHLTICLSKRRHLVHIRYRRAEPELLPMPQALYRLVTFYAHPADKGREIMLEYNERAAVTRILIPAVIEDWAATRPELYAAWRAILPEEGEPDTSGMDRLGGLLSFLPEVMSLRDAKPRYPDAFRRCAEAFDALVRDRFERPLRIRDRALHHLGEMRRVAEAVSILRSLGGADPHEETEAVDGAMRRIGRLLDESHRSLRDLYDVSTPIVERLIGVVGSDPAVRGARLMGGGFGGNVLALTGTRHVGSLVERVRSGFFEPTGQDPNRAGAVMISTPGDGLSALDALDAARRAAEGLHENPHAAETMRPQLRSLLGRLLPGLRVPAIQPVILAAGKGARARASGLRAPKPLAPVLGIPSVLRVLQAVNSACSPAAPPVVIVSPETERGVREALGAERVTYVLQPKSLGTGDAVLRAAESLRGFSGRTLVVWGTQPVLRAETVRLSIALAALFHEFAMVVPTTLMSRPYAPLYRDEHGRVTATDETHLERKLVPKFGETNIGLFLLWNGSMLEELERLHGSLWLEGERRYARPHGELGFPNEMIRALACRQAGVIACPIADWREEKGIKHKTDISLCEQYIRELENPTASGELH